MIAALATAAPAQAAHPDLWATVNRCDTPASPDAMGVRASMPGNGTRQRMYMRFNASWYDRTREAWFPVKGLERSEWVYVGTARYRARQSGWTFQFAPPQAGSDFVVRGVVEYQWRKRKRRTAGRGSRQVVVHAARANTRHGISNVPAGDPPGTSEGLCVIRP
jgi:hypothetical protein